MTDRNHSQYLSILDIEALLESLEQTSIEELELTRAGNKVRIKRCPADKPKTIETVPQIQVPIVPERKQIISPYVGTFFIHHPDIPNASIESETTIGKGQIIALIKVAGTYRPVRAMDDGVDIIFLVEEGDLVEYGTPLFEFSSKNTI